MKILNSFISSHGRITRSEWFLKIILLAIFCVAFGNLAETVIPDIGSTLFAAIFIWCGLTLSVQRLHDVSISAWKLLVLVIPIVGPLWLLILLLKRGMEGVNRYGEDPLTRDDYLKVDISK